jgi:hypothetical protein
MPRIVESQPINSSLRFSLALDGFTGVKEELVVFTRSTSLTDMLRRFPANNLTCAVASRVHTVFPGEGGRGDSPEKSTLDDYE